jgi:hypothetical protein
MSLSGVRMHPPPWSRMRDQGQRRMRRCLPEY